jgi:tripartite-type tricarboxylate transporter receptor subunit TctC
MIRAALKIGTALAWLSILALSQPIAASLFPSRPVKILVGFAAGGPADLPARYLAEQLGESLSEPVIVENKPGAASMLAVEALLSQPADGHTLLLCTHYDAINTVLYKSVKYRLDELAPISLLSKYYQVVAVSKKLPVASMTQFIEYAKAHPGQLNYGTLGPGSTQAITAQQLQQLGGIEMTGITYGGAAPAIQELIAGRIDLFVGPPLTVMPQYQAGLVKALGVTAPERMASDPNLPTLTELGLPIVDGGWLGVCTASGVPRPVIDLLNRDLVAIVNADGFRKLIDKTGSIAGSSTPEQLGEIIHDTATARGELIRKFGMQID